MPNKSSLLKKGALLLFAILLVAALSFAVYNKIAPVSWNLYGNIDSTDGVAIAGYDPVAYVTEHKAVPGSPKLTVKWQGVAWHFNSKFNQSMFDLHPEKWAPQYGGYCAYAISKGLTVRASPKIWAIKNKKIYLFHDKTAQEKFVKALPQGVIEKANKQWATRH